MLDRRKPRHQRYQPGEDVVIAEPSVIQIYHDRRGGFRIQKRPLKIVVEENLTEPRRLA